MYSPFLDVFAAAMAESDADTFVPENDDLGREIDEILEEDEDDDGEPEQNCHV